MAVAPHSARSLHPRQGGNPAKWFFRRLPESALADPRLPRSALAVLGQLDGFARDKVECWPSVATLAEALGLCRRTVQIALARLKACGYITEKPATNPTGRVLVLLWRTEGAQAPTSTRAQEYSQGLPWEGRKPARPNQSQVLEGRKGFGSASFKIPIPEPIPPTPRPLEPRPTEAEKRQTLKEWVEAVPVGSPLARLLAARLKV